MNWGIGVGTGRSRRGPGSERADEAHAGQCAFDLCTDEALDLRRLLTRCNFAPCDLIQAEPFVQDCYVNNEPCGACLWGAGLFHCLS